MARYVNRFEEYCGSYKPFLVTFTVKNGEDLAERLNHLKRGVQEFCKKRHRAASSEWKKTRGGVFSYEIKRGSGSGLWHPHCHAVILTDPNNPLDAELLREEWAAFMSDSHMIDVRPIDTENSISGFAEVFKYAVKFSDMGYKDRLDAYLVCRKQRLISAFGCLYGVDDVTPEDFVEPAIEGDYIELLARWSFQHGNYLYRWSVQETGAARLEQWITLEEYHERLLE